MNYEEIINNIRCRCGHCSFVIRRANDRNESILDANVEALADGESQTINVQCSMTSPILYCGVYCHSCGLLWTVPGTSGQYISGSGVCTCGATL